MATDKKPLTQVISVNWGQFHTGVGSEAQVNICEQTLAQATY